MIFKIGSELLSGILSSVKGGLGNKSIGVSAIKIVAEEDKVLFYTNNYRVGYTAIAKIVEVDQVGVALVSGDAFLRFAQAACSDTLVVRLLPEDKQLRLIDGRRTATISIIGDDDFTEPIVGKEEIAKMDLSELKSVLKIAVSTAATNESIQDGVYMDSSRVVGLDNMMASVVPFDNVLQEPLLIPREAAKEIVGFSFDGQCIIRASDNVLTVEMESDEDYLALSFLLLNVEEYPSTSLDRILGVDNQYFTNIPVGSLYNEIDYISLLSTASDQTVTMILKSDYGIIEFVGSAHMSSDESRSDMDFDAFSSVLPDEAEITYNVNRLLLALKLAIGSGGSDSDVTISYNDTPGPTRIECGDLVMFLSPSKRY
jgi:hypothetical protein